MALCATRIRRDASLWLWQRFRIIRFVGGSRSKQWRSPRVRLYPLAGYVRVILYNIYRDTALLRWRTPHIKANSCAARSGGSRLKHPWAEPSLRPRCTGVHLAIIGVCIYKKCMGYCVVQCRFRAYVLFIYFSFWSNLEFEINNWSIAVSNFYLL